MLSAIWSKVFGGGGQQARQAVDVYEGGDDNDGGLESNVKDKGAAAAAARGTSGSEEDETLSYSADSAASNSKGRTIRGSYKPRLPSDPAVEPTYKNPSGSGARHQQQQQPTDALSPTFGSLGSHSAGKPGFSRVSTTAASAAAPLEMSHTTANEQESRFYGASFSSGANGMRSSTHSSSQRSASDVFKIPLDLFQAAAVLLGGASSDNNASSFGASSTIISSDESQLVPPPRRNGLGSGGGGGRRWSREAGGAARGSYAPVANTEGGAGGAVAEGAYLGDSLGL